MKNNSKTRKTIIYFTIFLFILSIAHVSVGSPLPIYGQAQYEDGNVAEGAFVNVTSDKGYLTTTVDSEGYWQVDSGAPKNWPIGTLINIKINKTENKKIWQGEKDTTIDSDYVNVGTILLYSTDIPNIKPVANISLDNSYKYFIGNSIVFDGSKSYDSDGEIIEYRWDFIKNENSDTILSSNPKISHIFTEPGEYTIELQVKDDSEEVDIETTTIQISNDPSVVEIICEKKGLTYQNITFEANILNDITNVNYTWDFDDNTFGYSKKIDHIFTSSANFFVKLIVRDTENIKYYDSTEITIELDSDEDLLSDEIENRIGSSVYSPNNFMNLIINDQEHIIVDTNNDEKFNIFYNQTSNKTSNLKSEKDNYLIDDNIDGYYDYSYNTTEGKLIEYDDNSEKNNGKNKNDEQETPGFSLILIIFTLTIIILLRKKN